VWYRLCSYGRHRATGQNQGTELASNPAVSQLDISPDGQPQGGLTESAAWRIVSRGILFTVGVGVALWLVIQLLGIVAQIIVAVIVAAGMTPLVDRLAAPASRDDALPASRRPSRTLVVVALYLALLLTCGLAATLLVPPILAEAEQLIQRLPTYIAGFQELLAGLRETYPFLPPLDFATELTTQIRAGTAAVGQVLGQVVAALDLLLSFTLVLFMALYMTADSRRIHRYLVGLFPPERREQADSVMRGIGERLGGWVRGQLLLCTIIGVVTLIGLWLIGVRYAVLLALIAGIGELIPVIGPILSAIPAILIAFLHSPVQAGLVLLLYIFIQQFENYVVVPKVMERAVALHPLVVLVALIAGAELFGITGAILSVPVAAALSVVVIEVRRERGARERLKKQALQEYAEAAAHDPEMAITLIRQAAVTVAATPPVSNDRPSRPANRLNLAPRRVRPRRRPRPASGGQVARTMADE
jgi:predicted PurR-regulated permease PerM